jgi:hypothetical protein
MLCKRGGISDILYYLLNSLLRVRAPEMDLLRGGRAAQAALL